MRKSILFACLTTAGCISVSVQNSARSSPAAAPHASDSAEALALFRENIDAIHKRDRPRYLATYLESPRLARNGPNGLQLGWEGWDARTSTSWPDTLIANNLTVVPIAAGVVYGSYTYNVRYGDSTSTGVSERLFVRTPWGWRIAVTSAFGSPLAYTPKRP